MNSSKKSDQFHTSIFFSQKVQIIPSIEFSDLQTFEAHVGQEIPKIM